LSLFNEHLKPKAKYCWKWR